MSRWEAIVEQAVLASGYVFWGCVVSSTPSGTSLQVMIESNEGIGIGDCVKTHKQIIACLGAEGIEREAYRLEVSSPGVDRVFFKFEQCEPYLGQVVKCRLKIAKDGKRKIVGKMMQLEDQQIFIQEEGVMHAIAWDDIAKINLKAEVMT